MTMAAKPDNKNSPWRVSVWHAADAGEQLLYRIFPILLTGYPSPMGAYSIHTTVDEDRITLHLYKGMKDDGGGLVRLVEITSINEDWKEFPSDHCIAQIAMFVG